ncbi:MAG: nucleoside deaminase [Nanoarchaeota archaeon]|nr:nucleoside deaminase [Nanoarchaeota archaeon]
MDHEKYMKEALKEAEKAHKKGNWPIGCVIVLDDKIIARGHNEIYSTGNKLAHAEMIALNKIAKKIFDKRKEAILYTTYEPCPMCFGAIVMARLNTLVYGTCVDESGYANYMKNLPPLFKQQRFEVKVVSGVLAEECKQMFLKHKIVT